MGARKFANVLALGLMGPAMHIELQQAYEWVNAYRRSNDKIVAGWEFLNDVLLQMTFKKEGEYKCFAWSGENVWLPSGLPMVYKDMRGVENNGRIEFSYLSGKNGKRSRLWGGGFDENWIQALARCAVTDQMLLVMDGGWRVVGMSHDELLVLAHKSQADRCMDEVLAAMRTVPHYLKGAPLDAEGGYDTYYSK